MSSQAKVFLLTKNITENSERFKAYLRDFIHEYSFIKLEVRIHKGNVLHDRFIVVKEKNIAYSLGTSLNGIGKKDCLMIQLPENVFYALAELFERRWEEAELFNP